MKNMSMWAAVAVLMLVGAAVWYEIQYRQASADGSGSPLRHVSAKKHQPSKPAPSGPSAPTNERGQLIG